MTIGTSYLNTPSMHCTRGERVARKVGERKEKRKCYATNVDEKDTCKMIVEYHNKRKG